MYGSTATWLIAPKIVPAIAPARRVIAIKVIAFIKDQEG
jgi:hypothetical protein